ncbi:hypothetical protein ACJX0J_005466, partial [Zea mays]
LIYDKYHYCLQIEREETNASRDIRIYPGVRKTNGLLEIEHKKKKLEKNLTDIIFYLLSIQIKHPLRATTMTLHPSYLLEYALLIRVLVMLTGKVTFFFFYSLLDCFGQVTKSMYMVLSFWFSVYLKEELVLKGTVEQEHTTKIPSPKDKLAKSLKNTKKQIHIISQATDASSHWQAEVVCMKCSVVAGIECETSELLELLANLPIWRYIKTMGRFGEIK